MNIIDLTICDDELTEIEDEMTEIEDEIPEIARTGTPGTPETPGTPKTPGTPETPGTLMPYVEYSLTDAKMIAKYVIWSNKHKEGCSENKVIANMEFINRFIKYNASDPSATMIYIDGHSSRTTRMALRAGIKPDQCVAITNDVKAAKRIREHINDVRCCAFGVAVKSITKELINSTNFVWYDGNQTIMGNSTINPFLDIMGLIRTLNKNFTLAITVSTRANNNKNTTLIKKKLSGSVIDESDIAAHLETYKYAKISKRGKRGKWCKSGRPTKKRGFEWDEQKIILENTIRECNYTFDDDDVKTINCGSVMFWMADLICLN
jgi:hypothetical protein